MKLFSLLMFQPNLNAREACVPSPSFVIVALPSCVVQAVLRCTAVA